MARRRIAEEAPSNEVAKAEGENWVEGEPAKPAAAAEKGVRRRSIATSPQEPPAAGETSESVVPGVLDGGEVVVVWAREQFSPAQYHSFEVGPFTATVKIGAGESLAAAARRAMDDLRRFAEAERERKRDSYLAMVKAPTRG